MGTSPSEQLDLQGIVYAVGRYNQNPKPWQRLTDSAYAGKTNGTVRQPSKFVITVIHIARGVLPLASRTRRTPEDTV